MKQKIQDSAGKLHLLSTLPIGPKYNDLIFNPTISGKTSATIDVLVIIFLNLFVHLSLIISLALLPR